MGYDNKHELFIKADPAMQCPDMKAAAWWYRTTGETYLHDIHPHSVRVHCVKGKKLRTL